MQNLQFVFASLLFAHALPLVAQVNCSATPDATGFRYPDSARQARDQFYDKICRSSIVPVVIATDPNVKGRFEAPSRGHRLGSGDIYPDTAKLLAFEGSVVVAFLVDADGGIQHVSVIESSGHTLLDNAVSGFWKQYRFDAPGKLDGGPARIIYVQEMRFKLTGPSIGIPSSFSDTALKELGNRILVPYAHNDAAALYEDLDETTKKTSSPKDIQKQLAAYAKQFGEIQDVAYRGLSRVTKSGGTSIYELIYQTQFEDSRTATMLINAIDRAGRPGISSFEITGKTLAKVGN